MSTYDTATRNRDRLKMLGDEMRMEILCLLFEWEKGCVSSIAEAVEGSVANTSYHLNTLADHDYLTRQPDGRRICYEINDTEFMHCLRKLVMN